MMPTDAPHSGLMHDMANVRDPPVIWRLQTVKHIQTSRRALAMIRIMRKVTQFFLSLKKSAEQLFEQQIC